MPSSRPCWPAAALLVLLCLHPTPGFAVAAATPIPPIPVTGQVLGPAGSPLAGARVRLVPVPSFAGQSCLELEGRADVAPAALASTGDDGSFLLEAPGPGMWRVVVEAKGMVAQEKEIAPLTEEAELPVVKLERDAGLEVRVQGSGGEPLAGARVVVQGERGMDDLPQRGWSAPVRVARTDEKGVAVLPREAGETLLVQAGIEERPVAQQKVESGASVTLRLPAGASRQIRVMDAAGRKPVPGVFVYLGEGHWCAGRTSPEGLFSVPLPDGRKEEALLLFAEDGRYLQASLSPPAQGEKGPRVLNLPVLETLDGRVVSAADGQPVAGALVWSMDPGLFRRSGPDGSYRIEGVRMSSFPLVVQAAAPGFLPAQSQMSPEASPQGSTVALEPSRAAGGVVVDEQGQPVGGVTVRAVPQESMYQPRSSETVLARTSGAGRFRLGRLESGTLYQLRLAKPGFAPATADLPPLVPGQPASSLRILLHRGRTGFGRVVNRAEQPVPGASVVLRPAFSGNLETPMVRSLEFGDDRYEASSGGDGRFEVRDLPAGTYDLAIQAKGYAPLRVPGLAVPEGGGATDLGTVILAPGVSVEGYVVDPQGHPIPGAEVRASEAEAGFSARIVEERSAPPILTGPDGFFRIEDRRTGETVDLVASRSGYAPAALPGIEVPAKEPVRIVLKAASAVEGRTVGPDGEPLSGVMVFVYPSDPAAMMALGSAGMAQTMPATSKADGSFRIENVAPGTVDLHAMTLGRPLAQLKNLEVPPGKDLTGVEVVLTRGAVVEGRILTASGKPVTGAEVNVMEGDGTFGATSDGEGRYRLEGVSPGPHMIQATHTSHPPTQRQLAVRPGENALDLTFDEGTVQVSGRVLDQAGEPVTGARVYLREREGGFSDPSFAMSGADGSFTLSGVVDGVYHLFADKPGFARGREGKLLAVAGAPVSGIEVRLTPGGSVVGRILGLDFTDLSQVEVMAESQVGHVMPDGSYRIDHVPPGELQVVASLSARSRQAEGQVVLEPGASEARLDLEFREGFTLNGRVLRNGEPLPGENLYLLSQEEQSSRWAKTDHEGRFRIAGLEAGSYELQLLGGARFHQEEIEITADRDVLIDLRGSSISGRVVDAADRKPLANASVAAISAEEDQHRGVNTTTDSRGAFVLRDVPEGAWKVEASLAGFTPAEVDVQSAGAPVDGVELALQAAEGLTLEVVLSSGQLPGAVGVWVLDTAGRLVSSGVHPAGEGGRVRIADVPPGLWELIVDVPGWPLTPLSVSVPGDAGQVVLSPPGTLDLRVVPLLNEGTGAKVRLTDGEGRPFRIPGPGGVLSDFILNAGTGRFERLPAGAWRILVTTADGRLWTQNVAFAPGQTAQVTLDAPR